MTDLINRAVERRYRVLAATACCLWVAKLWGTGGDSGDWVLFVDASRSITSVTSVGVFFGPLMLVLAEPFTLLSLWTGWVVMSGLCMGLAVISIRWVEDIGTSFGLEEGAARPRAALFGGVVALYALSSPGVTWGHPEDVIALACVVYCTRAVARNQWPVAGLALAAAIGFKPWAALALPLSGALAGVRLRGLATTIGVVGLLWLPFLALHHGAVDAGPISPPIEPWSGPDLLGGTVGSPGSWARRAQVLTAITLGSVALLRRRWELVPAIAFAVRINVDPVTLDYYGAGAVVGVLIWDLAHPARLPGSRTVAAAAALFLIPTDLAYVLRIHSPGVAAVLRILVLLGVLASLARAPGTERREASGSPEARRLDERVVDSCRL